MKYRDGYLCEYDDLWQLPVDILEDIIIRIYQDSYLSRDAKLDLLKDYMDVRKSKLAGDERADRTAKPRSHPHGLPDLSRRTGRESHSSRHVCGRGNQADAESAQ